MDLVNRIMQRLPACRGALAVHRGGGVDRLRLCELYDPVRRVVQYLRDRGLRRGDRVGIAARNSLEVVLLDLACVYGGFVSAPVDRETADVEALIREHHLALFFSDDGTILERGGRTLHDLGKLRAIAGINGFSATPPAAEPPATWGAADALTLKFTSGSTGRPKALAATVGSIDDSIGDVHELFHHGPGDRLLVFLPFSLLQQRYWLYSAIVFDHDLVLTSYQYVFFCLKEAAPTVIMGVPGFFDALKQLVGYKLLADPALAREHERYRGRFRDGERLEAPFAPVHELLGGAVRYLWTGSAPARMETLRFYTELGIPIYEGYGLNETCIVSKNHGGACRLGSVGRVLPNKKVWLDVRGQILVRPRHPVNVRYSYCGAGENEHVFGEEGVVRTGDLGRFDDDGFLYILGRVNDLIVLVNGKNVYPERVEDALRSAPAVGHCMVYGHGRAHLVALVVPRDDTVPKSEIERQVAQVNIRLPSAEKVKGLVIARESFTPENGLLTSQYKLRRHAITARYRDALDACYLGGVGEG